MKQHSFDGVSFFTGLVITLIGLLFLIPNTPSDIIDAITNLGSWFWPTALLVAGVAILLPIFYTRGKSDESDDHSLTGG